MSTVTKPMALDETFNTTESTPRNQADVLAGIQQAIREGFGQVAYAVEYDNTDSGLTATNVQDAIDEVDAALDVVEDDIESIEDDIESVKEVTGNPITITDASETYAQGLSVGLEPKQDLHGYDYPWVGGAGKNKVDISETTISSSDYVFNLTNLNIPQGTYTFSFDCTEDGNASFACGDDNTDFVNDPILVRDGKGAITFTTTNTITQMRLYGYAATYSNFQLEVGSQVTSFAPYSNICPISGYEGVEVEDVGVNQWDEEYAAGYLDANGAFNPDPNYLSSENFIPIRPNTQYYLYSGTYSSFVVFYYDNSQQLISYEPKNKNTTFTTQSNTAYIKFGNSYGEGSAYNNDISINYPATDTNYHPYQSRTASITFGQTVYGGSVDVTNGGTEKTVDIEDLSTLSWLVGGASSQLKYASVSGYTNVVMAEQYKATTKTPNELSVGECTYYNNRIYVYPVSTSDDILGNAVLTLTTPTTIATPKTDLKLLQGTNNLTTNGTTITIDYIPNNSIGDAVKASEEYADRAVERVIPKAKLACFYEIFDESGTLYDATIPEDCNFFLVEYRIQNRIGSTLIKAKSIDFYNTFHSSK